MNRSIIAALALLSAGPALAASPASELPTARVSYADLDLSAPAGRATLERRVTQAVHKVCPEVGYAEPVRMQLMMQCRIAARRGAAIQVAQAEQTGGKATQLAFAGR